MYDLCIAVIIFPVWIDKWLPELQGSSRTHKGSSPDSQGWSRTRRDDPLVRGIIPTVTGIIPVMLGMIPGLTGIIPMIFTNRRDLPWVFTVSRGMIPVFSDFVIFSWGMIPNKNNNFLGIIPCINFGPKVIPGITFWHPRDDPFTTLNTPQCSTLQKTVIIIATFFFNEHKTPKRCLFFCLQIHCR